MRVGRCPPIAGNLTLKCVGTLITCPYMAGVRSRRGSPKAGTTVLYLLMVESYYSCMRVTISRERNSAVKGKAKSGKTAK